MAPLNQNLSGGVQGKVIRRGTEWIFYFNMLFKPVSDLLFRLFDTIAPRRETTVTTFQGKAA